MQGVKQRSPKLFYRFCLDEHIPEDHPYRRIDRELDLRFLYEHTAGYYGKDGQKSIDPVVFFKMCLVGYLNNIASDRALVRYCQDSLAARWVIGYDIDESLPVHSTLSRTRSLFGESVYEQVFVKILDLCVQKGMISGRRQVVDSALVKANASLDSMQRKVILEDASEYCRQVQVENSEQEPPRRAHPKEPLAGVERSDRPKQTKTQRSNKTHQSASDPDARMTRKPGKPTALYYRGHISVDGDEGVIVAAMGDYGDREDHQSLPSLLEQIQTHLADYSISASKMIGDSKYNTSESIKACRQAGMTPFMPNPSGYKPKREGFSYDPQSDSYRCSQGVELPFKHEQKVHGRYSQKVYKSKASDCAGCPLAGKCLPAKAGYKSLYHSSDKALYDQMHERLQTLLGKRLISKRKGIVEPVFGNLLWHYGMRKVYARGKPAAGKHVKMAAMAYNLKKWLQKSDNGPFGKATAMSKEAANKGLAFFVHLMVGIIPNVKYSGIYGCNFPLKCRLSYFLQR